MVQTQAGYCGLGLSAYLDVGDHGQHVEQQPADGVGGVVHGSAQLQADAAGGQLLDDVASVGQRPREAVEFGDHQGVAGAASREGLA